MRDGGSESYYELPAVIPPKYPENPGMHENHKLTHLEKQDNVKCARLRAPPTSLALMGDGRNFG